MTFLSPIMKLNRRLCSWVCSQHWANRHEVTLLLLALLLFLRLPNLSEPYWYGDEGIYLTIGTGLRHGLRLYRDIVDHKTPIIYWLAMAPTQMWFRTIFLLWMAAATVFFSHALRRLTTQRIAIAASFLFVILTSLPAFEGNIPNGELFVIGFISLALWFLAKSQDGERRKRAFLLASGVAGGLAILTKVPALLDVAALGALLWFWELKKQRLSVAFFRQAGIFTSGFLLPILLSLAYFFLRGTLSDYLQFGLLYNLRYSQSWQLPFYSPVLTWLFTLPGKLLVFGIMVITISLGVYRQKLSPLSGWSALWIAAALFAALLSNRPYPHYLLQVAPPLALSLALFFGRKESWWAKTTISLTWLLVLGSLFLLNFRTYPLMEYYYRFWNFSVGKQNLEEYTGSFDRLVSQNQKLVPIIVQGSLPEDRLFIWGTNPMLYAQTQRVPASRFTVSFHIHDFKAYDSTMGEIRQAKPLYIVIMKQESPLPGLEEYISENYFLVETTPDMVLFRRFNAKSQLLLQ